MLLQFSLVFVACGTYQSPAVGSMNHNMAKINEADDFHDDIISVPVIIKPPATIDDDSLQIAIDLEGRLKHISENLAMSPVAKKIVANYFNSKNKEPGGHCLTTSKVRFEKAYKDVYGHSFYNDLPKSIASKYYSPEQVFDHIYASTQGRHRGWRTLPKEYRAKGNAGAVAYAGMGELVDWSGIWNGKLEPGALMQVWRSREDYKKVIKGTEEKDFDPFGHSFIFLEYVRGEDGKIEAILIADQGYQSFRPLTPKDYEVWWAANLKV